MCTATLLSAISLFTYGAPDAAELQAELTALEARWSQAMEAAGIPGFAVSVVNKDGVIYENAFGLRDIDPEKPFTASTSTYIASVTKVYVTLAIMQLVDAGKVDLDKPVRTYLPRLELPDDELARTITIRDLLCHRYGINAPRAVFHDAYTGLITDDIFYDALKEADVEGAWDYTNTHFTILGRVIESVTGETWRDYLAQHLFEPADMSNTTGYASELYANPESAIPLRRYLGELAPSAIRKTDTTMHAAGGLGTSASDMARWLQIHLNGGEIDGTRLISKEALDEILTVHEQPGTSFFRFKRTEMGLGWYLGRYEEQLMVHHFGGYAGASAHCSFMPEHGIGVAVLTNTSDENSILIHHVAADVYDLLIERDGDRRWRAFNRQATKGLERALNAQKERVIEPGPLSLSLPTEAYAKSYTSEGMGTLVVRREDESLAANIGNIEIEFFPGEEDAPIGRGYFGRLPFQFEIENGSVKSVTLPRFWRGDVTYHAQD